MFQLLTSSELAPSSPPPPPPPPPHHHHHHHHHTSCVNLWNLTSTWCPRTYRGQHCTSPCNKYVTFYWSGIRWLPVASCLCPVTQVSQRNSWGTSTGRHRSPQVHNYQQKSQVPHLLMASESLWILMNHYWPSYFFHQLQCVPWPASSLATRRRCC